MSLMFKGAEFFWAARGFCCPFLFDYKNALPWHDASFPICHYSQHAPVPLALYFRQGDTWEQYSGQTVLTGLFLSISQSLRDARRLLVHILHTVSPGTTVAADVRIWLLGQLFESEETRFLISQLTTVTCSRWKCASSVHFSLLKLPEKMVFDVWNSSLQRRLTQYSAYTQTDV